MLDKILNTKKGRIVISIILGFGLAALFKRECRNRCIVRRPPKSSQVENNIYKHDNKCYKYQSEITTCSTNPISE